MNMRRMRIAVVGAVVVLPVALIAQVDPNSRIPLVSLSAIPAGQNQPAGPAGSGRPGRIQQSSMTDLWALRARPDSRWWISSSSARPWRPGLRM
jgi:hypothetical protein